MTEKKSFLEKAFDLISTRDEKAALDEAKHSVAEAQQMAEAAKQKQEAAERAVDAAEQRALAAEAKAKSAAIQQRQQRLARMKQAFDERNQMLKASKFIASHAVVAGETLSHLSLQYYGSATKPYWALIHEANKEVIGDDPNLVREGLVLKIPELPAELKKD